MLGLLVVAMWSSAMLEPEPELTPCALAITGMPVPVMSHHRLVVGTDDERPLAPQMELWVGDTALRVRVLGLRYYGERWISREECEARRGPLPMTVEPLPARVVFPCPPRGLTVACPGCAGEAGARVYLAEELPPIEMEAWSREVEVLLRAPGYHRQARRLVLHPGPNSVHVELEQL